MASLESQGTNNPFDDLVDSIKTLNGDQNDMAKEAAVYSKELQDHLERDAMNMSQSQIDAMQQLIMTLKEGRLDDLEADKEQLLRGRMEKKRDEERNDSLFDIFKQLKLQFRLLQMQFKDEKGSRIFGFLVRTAIFSFLVGAFKGFMTPYANIGKGIIKGATSMGKTLGLPVLFDNIKNVFKGFGDRVAKTFKFSPEGKGGGMFAKAARGILNAGKDLGKIALTSVKNVGNFFKGIAGFFTGKKSFLMGFTKIESGIKASGIVGQGANKLVQIVLKPFRMLANLPVSIAHVFAKGIDKAAASVKAGGANFAKIGSKVFNFFKNLPVLSTVFSALDKFKAVFMRFGMAFGQILRPILGIFGLIKGFITGFKSQEDGLNKIIAGVFDGLKLAFNLLFGSLLDFGKQLIGFVLDIFTFGMFDIRKTFKNFSFADTFDMVFDTIKNGVLGFLNRLRDGFADLGVGGMIKNISLDLLSIFMKIAAFPKAIAAGALSAIAAAMPGGESPKEAFSRKFNEVMSKGQATIDAMKSKRDGKDSDGEIIDALSKEGKALETRNVVEAASDLLRKKGIDEKGIVSFQNSSNLQYLINQPAPSDFSFRNANILNQYSD